VPAAVPELAERLTAARLRSRLSQAAVASLVGVHAGQVGRYERGEQAPSKRVLRKLAKLYGIPLDELLALLTVDTQ